MIPRLRPMSPMELARRMTGLAALLLLLAIAPARAGDFAERTVLGFSPDGRYFAFEQFGAQDGSGFPYADIFVIDTQTDDWVDGTPFRILLKDERAEVKWARREAMTRAGTLLKKLLISHPGQLLVSNPPGELSADPYAVTANARAAIPLAREEPWTFRLDEMDLPLKRCTDLLSSAARGFRLSVQPPEKTPSVIHLDKAIPETRGCPMRYAISDVVMHHPKVGNRVFAVLISVYAYGFEGPDRRFLTVTYSAK